MLVVSGDGGGVEEPLLVNLISDVHSHPTSWDSQYASAKTCSSKGQAQRKLKPWCDTITHRLEWLKSKQLTTPSVSGGVVPLALSNAAGGVDTGQEGQEGGVVKRRKETFGGDEYLHYLNYGDV